MVTGKASYDQIGTFKHIRVNITLQGCGVWMGSRENMPKCLSKKQLGPVGTSEGEEAGGTGNLCFSRVNGLCGILLYSPKGDFY